MYVWAHSQFLAPSHLFKPEVCLASLLDCLQLWFLCSKFLKACLPYYWSGYAWHFFSDYPCLLCLLLICAINPGLKFWLMSLSRDLVPPCQLIVNFHLSSTFNLIIILYLSAWLFLNTACDLMPYSYWVHLWVYKLRSKAPASWHMCPFPALAVPVSNTSVLEWELGKRPPSSSQAPRSGMSELPSPCHL